MNQWHIWHADSCSRACSLHCSPPPTQDAVQLSIACYVVRLGRAARSQAADAWTRVFTRSEGAQSPEGASRARFLSTFKPFQVSLELLLGKCCSTGFLS